MKRLVLAVVLAGCPAGKQPAATSADAAVRAEAIQLRGADGSPSLRLVPSGTGYLVEGSTSGTIEKRADGLVLVDGGVDVAVLRPGPAGPVLVDTGGTVLARIHAPAPDTFDLLQPDGVAILRTRIEADGVVARDRSGMAIAAGQLDGEVWEIDAPGGKRLASVRGTRDGLAALVLALPDLPAPMRALAAAHALAE
jgi:hypothetical protein